MSAPSQTATAAPRRADLHTHTALCRHASGAPEEYLAAALKAGLAYWGVSDHFPAPAGYDAAFRMAPDELPQYFEILDSLRAAANNAGAAYWDMYGAMGGDGSMVEWVKARPQLAGNDYVHFTPKGAEAVG